MNFDDLHDPDPPRPGESALAVVAGRARQIRRRRTTLLTAGGVVAALAVAVPTALVVTGDTPEERLTSASVPTVTTQPQGLPTSSGSTTQSPTSTTARSTPVVGDPDPTTGSSTTSPSSSTTTTSAPPVALPAVAAVRADGDAVLIDGTGAETLVYDGADPRVQPAEGELTVVDSVAVTPGDRVFVSTCCEPVPGSYEEIAVGTGPIEGSLVYGHGLELGADGAHLLSVGASSVTVATLDGEIVAEAIAEGAVSRMPYSAGWASDETVALVELRQPDSGNEFRLLTLDASLSGYDAATGVVIGTDLDAPWPVLAGVGADGSVLVFQGAGDPATASALQAYDPVTLERKPAGDVAIPEPATFAWFEDGVLTWIGADGALHVGDDVVPREYRWARPIG